MEKKDIMVELQHVTKAFGDFVAVEDFNLEVKKGEFVTFLGPSGCGKTTTLRMIAGFELPTEGTILLDGKDISMLPPYQRPINTVFQRYALFTHLDVFENISFGLKLKKLPKAEIVKKVRRVLEMVDLEGFEKRKVTTLSGGQQQRIAIARALVNEPEILLLDEPLGALDLKMRKEMQLELKEMHQKLGITFIYVTHDQEEALTMSDKIVVMSDGEIQQVGTPEEIYNEPANAFVADFIGESNLYSGIMTGDKVVRFCGADFACLDPYEKGTPVDVVVRPEDVILTEPGKGKLRGVVDSVIFKGIHYEITVLSGKNEVVIQTTRNVKTGTAVGIEVEPDGIHVMPVDVMRNKYECSVTDGYRMDFFGESVDVDITALYPGSVMRDGRLLDNKGEQVAPEKIHLIASVEPQNIHMSDDLESGIAVGNIIQMLYKGDHYQYIVRTDEEDDFVVDDPDLWNMDDRVSVSVDPEKIQVSLKK
ncbi:MAG: ABC transporter ATP-binding protein [Clostridiales bacterium]|nr:ABC transporter ATP-binding protein [Clostridiales bacterium]